MLKRNKQKGIALYTAIIVAGVVLLLAVAMTDIAFRQLILARTSLISQHAFYVAESGVECALYYDVGLNIFPSNEAEVQDFEDNYGESGGIPPIACAGYEVLNYGTDISDENTHISIVVNPSPDVDVSTIFKLEEIGGDPTRCAEVTVDKKEDAGDVKTNIKVDGRYPCGAFQNVERTIHVRYGF